MSFSFCVMYAYKFYVPGNEFFNLHHLMKRMYLANFWHKVSLQSHQPSDQLSSTVQLWMHHPQSPTLDAQKILQEQHTRWAWHYVICTEILSSNAGKDTSHYHDCYCHKTVQVHRYPSHHLPERNT